MSLTLVLVAFAVAEPNPYVDALERARAAILTEDWRVARAALADAEVAAPTNPAVISATDLGRLDYYRGVALWRTGARDDALVAWRRSLTLAPSFQPLADVLPETDGQDAYYALASEIAAYPSKPLAAPEDTTAVVFVDGARAELDRVVPEGRHFVQLRCEDGSIHGAWYRYGPPPPDYLVLCAGGSYPEPPREAALPDTPPHTGNPGLVVDVAGWSLLAAGAGLLGTGAYWNFAVVNPLWAAGQDARANPGSLTGAEAEALVADYDRNRWVVIGLMGAGLAAAAPGFVLGPLELNLTAAPSAVGVSGRW